MEFAYLLLFAVVCLVTALLVPLSLQEPTIPADQRRFIIALLALILCSVLIIENLNPQQ